MAVDTFIIIIFYLVRGMHFFGWIAGTMTKKDRAAMNLMGDLLYVVWNLVWLFEGKLWTIGFLSWGIVASYIHYKVWKNTDDDDDRKRRPMEWVKSHLPKPYVKPIPAPE